MAGRAEYDRELLGRLVPWIDVSVATFLTAGTGAEQAALAINNPAGTRIVTLRRVIGSFAATVAGQRPILLYKAPALATLGTVLVPTEDRTAQPAATLVARGATAADLGALTPITVGAGGVRVWRRSSQGIAAGFQFFDIDGIDQSIEPGESFYLAVNLDAGAGGSTVLTAYLTEHLGLG